MPEGIDLAEAVKDGAPVSQEDLLKLLGGQEDEVNPELSELSIACAGGLKVVTIPCTVELDDGREFIVDNFRAWGWTPFGLFAIGRFSSDEEDVERQRLFNGDRVTNVELQMEVYEAEVAAQQAAAEKAAETESEDTSGEDAADSPSD